MRIEISATAESQLLAIHASATEYSPKRAMKLMKQFHRRLKQLTHFPLSGERIPELDFPQLRQVLVGPYRVLYHALPDRIEIVGFLHSAQQWPLP